MGGYKAYLKIGPSVNKKGKPFITSLEKFAQDMKEECQRMVTEEEEEEIREVASDINERAFYGKILNTKNKIYAHAGVKTSHIYFCIIVLNKAYYFLFELLSWFEEQTQDI